MIAIIALAAVAWGFEPAAAAQTSSTDNGDQQVVCKTVVSADKGSKPFQMCLSKSEWAQSRAKALKDANRIECRYEEVPGSRFKSKKICQPASAWAEHRRLEREQVEQIQRNVCVSGAGC